MTLFAELKRRHVYRVAVAYAVVGWLLIEVATQVFPVFELPGWTEKLVVLLVLLGFPVAVMLAWAFEMTPQGVRRTEPAHSAEARAPEQHRHVGRKLDFLIIGVLSLAVAVLAWRQFAPHASSDIAVSKADKETAKPTSPATTAQPGIPRKSIAVLPFENLSGDKDNAYFADGIQDQILTGLAKLGDVKVISRTSTQRYASRPDNIGQIARELGVAHILEGSVQRAGKRVRINVQLIDTQSDSHLWAETYDRTLDDIFQVEDEVAGKIAQSLAARLPGEGQGVLVKKPTSSTAAYDAYLKARAVNARADTSWATFGKAIAMYREALALDPDFTLAIAELANTEITAYWFGYDNDGSLLADARTNIERGTRLAPHSPQMASAHGVYAYYVEHDFAKALKIMRKARAQLPGDSALWLWTSLLERRLGLWDASIADNERARSLNPNDTNVSFNLAFTLTAARRYAQATAAADVGLSAAPGDPDLLNIKQWAAWQVGGLDAGARALAPGDPARPQVQVLLGQQALMARDYASAIDHYRRGLGASSAGHEVRMTDTAFGGYLPSPVVWSLRLALAEQRAGDDTQSKRLYADAEARIRRELAAKPTNRYVEAAWHSALGTALAGQGRKDEAVAEAGRAVEMIPASKDRLDGPPWVDELAGVYAMNGDAAHAIPLLQQQLAIKGSYITRTMLRLDPAYDPIRSDPRFQGLLQPATATGQPDNGGNP